MIIVVLIVAVIIFIFYLIAKNKSNSITYENAKSKINQLDKVENLSESEFISFVRNNYDFYDNYFKIDGTGGGHGLETKQWSTSRYIIKSSIDTNDFSDFVEVYRKSDNEKIFSGCWGTSDEDDDY